METISLEYLEEQIKLHKNPSYGMASIGFAPIVAQLIDHMLPQTVMDYRAGKCHLKRTLDSLGVDGYQHQPFDPAFPGYGPALEADLVCCIDVLEHIEPELLDNMLLDLARVTKKIGFF